MNYFLKIFRLLLVSIVALFQFNAIAVPPTFVYRMDSRSPDDIFSNGFTSWGNNTNVFAHISGASCTEVSPEHSTSAFVSTSANREWAYRTAMIRFSLAPQEDYYLYRIRADENFFSAEDSLRLYANNNRDAVVTDANYVPSRMANEYITPTQIRRENIESVVIFHTAASTTEINHSINENYRPVNTHASTRAYNGQGDNVIHRRTWINLLPFVGACLGGSSSESRTLNSSYKEPVTTLEATLLMFKN